MSKKLVILFIPIQGFGHMNPCIGVGEQLKERGHEVHFIVNKLFEGKLKQRGFIEHLIVLKEDSDNEKESPETKRVKKLIELGILKKATPLEKTKMRFQIDWSAMVKPREQQLTEIINKLKPYLLVVDFILTPAIVKSKIAWINLFSPHILFGLPDERTPPGGSGLPAYDSTNWAEFKMEFEKAKANRNTGLEDWFREEGLEPPLVDKFIESPYLNIFMCPKELEYDDLRPLPENWLRFDSFIRTKEEEFEIPEKLKDKPGKLIYFSMGSIGCSDVELMKRLTTILAKSRHRFIVSKGVFADTYELPDNCWGQKMVPQTKVLPLVDLAIVHGGNNTLCEAFYFGKPLILMPIFGDQFDSAQRVDEKGFGIRLNPFECTENELLGAIEKLVTDDSLKKQMKMISMRIQESVKKGEVAEAIENYYRANFIENLEL